jgi:hypothetical protein
MLAQNGDLGKCTPENQSLQGRELVAKFDQMQLSRDRFSGARLGELANLLSVG